MAPHLLLRQNSRASVGEKDLSGLSKYMHAGVRDVFLTIVSTILY